ncbi:MAG: tetratricopeptide repeat protein, partial [Lachnospiraceae bacterium]|nr:tetratricopeptide repeat protein [Lachnospiraceae bacterium]
EKKALRYRSDNELIITPMNVKEPKHGGAVTILNIVLGLVIGVLAACFLILPTAVTNTRNDAEAENAKIYNEMDLKTARITELEQAAIKDREQIAQLEEAISQLKIDQTKADEIDTLLNAAVTYLTTADVLETDAQLTIARQSIDFEQASDSANQLYDSLVLAIGEEVSVALYEQGRELYDEDDYVQALSVLQRACEYNAENWDALYYLGHAYRMNEDYANARLCYEAFVTALPRTERASRAREHLQNMPQTTP